MDLIKLPRDIVEKILQFYQPKSPTAQIIIIQKLERDVLVISGNSTTKAN